MSVAAPVQAQSMISDDRYHGTARMSVAAPVQAQPAMGVAAGGAARRARQPGAWPPGS